MAANHGPGPSFGDARHRNAAGDRALLSARPSQGECSVGDVATCDLGNLAPGSEAFVIVTIRATGERDFVSTAIASARADDGSKRETSALTMTRGVRHPPALTLRRPVAEHDVLDRAQQHDPMDAARRRGRCQRRFVARRWRDLDEAERRGGERRILRLDRSRSA